MLIFNIFLFAMARLFVSIWLQIWLDDGDGSDRQALHQQNSTRSIHGNGSTSEEENLQSQNITDNPNLWFYQLIHGISLIVMIIFGLIKGLSLAYSLLKGSSVLHQAMLQRIMKSPMSFFDKTSSGKILNRFSRDMDEGGW